MKTHALKLILICFSFLFVNSCKQANTKINSSPIVKTYPKSIEIPEGMTWVPGGEFSQGALADDPYALAHEKPVHRVTVDGFFMDQTEVTNAQFKVFVKATGYLTIAERAVDWEVIKHQVPEGTEKPADSLLQPGTLTFMKCHSTPNNLNDYSQWWSWTQGANWKHPSGPASSIEGKEQHPVVHIAYEDALAYCEWAGRRLPTEAEWEFAARAQQDEAIFFWGKDPKQLVSHANTWEGEFPVSNTLEDGFERSAPVRSFKPNKLGLYDMAGNVWEWTSDWYHANYYQNVAAEKEILRNPNGASTSYNPMNPRTQEKVIKGGSFLCNASYCASYRISSRMGTTTDSALEHVGFRTVATLDMLQSK